MRVGIFSSAITTGTVDDVVAEARVVGEEGFASFWVSQIFSHARSRLSPWPAAGPGPRAGTSVVPTFRVIRW